MCPGAGEDRLENRAIKKDKIQSVIVNHCCVFGRPLSGVILLHYHLLSAPYSTITMNTASIKLLNEVCEAVL